MKHMLCLILFFALISGGYSQGAKSEKEVKKEAKQKKKEEQEAKELELYKAVGKLLESRKFILQARFLKNQEGTRVSVVPDLNFIQVDSIRAFLQIGSPQIAGYNAAGGISAEGLISRWTLEKNDKRRTYNVFLTVVLSGSVVDIFLTVNQNSFATASLSGLSSAQLTYDGDIVAVDGAGVKKGWTPGGR